MNYIFLFFASPIFYLFFNNDALLTYPCLFSLTSIIIVTFLIYFVLANFFYSKEKTKSTLYLLGILLWGIYPVCKFILHRLCSRNATIWEFVKNMAVVIFGVILFFGVLGLARLKDENCVKFNKFLDCFTKMFIAVFAFNMLVMTLGNRNHITVDSIQNRNVTNNKHPNIYHVLLDAHSSNYALKKYYNFDNNNFYQELERKGFSIIEPSFSNYPATQMSVASMLNLEYLPATGISATDLEHLRFNNKVFAFFAKTTIVYTFLIGHCKYLMEHNLRKTIRQITRFIGYGYNIHL